jgi:hypothetical protein
VGELATHRRDWPDWVIAAFVLWLPLQTLLALVLFQYGGLDAGPARALLLVKDAAAVAIIVALLPRAWSRFRWTAPDGLAAGYAAVIAVYAIVPRLLGDPAPMSAVLASLRELMLPVELYAMGRLAATAGVDAGRIARILIAAGVAAAAFALLVVAVTPPTFWASTLNMVRFVQEVQGFPAEGTLDSLSIVASYGQDASFVRAIGPFTHPVGAASYFAVALALALAAGVHAVGRTRLLLIGAAVVLALATLATISRGAWIAAGIVALVIATSRGRLRLALGVLFVFGAVVLLVPPFSHAVWSVSEGTDSSAQGHARTTMEGIALLLRHPLGLGVGHWDYLGAAYGSAAAPSENLYIAMAVAGGPVALGLFVAWIATLIARLRRAPSWVALGVTAALVGFALTAVINSPLLRFTTAASFWLLVGLTASTGLGTVTRPGRAPAEP